MTFYVLLSYGSWSFWYNAPALITLEQASGLGCFVPLIKGHVGSQLVLATVKLRSGASLPHCLHFSSSGEDWVPVLLLGKQKYFYICCPDSAVLVISCQCARASVIYFDYTP